MLKLVPSLILLFWLACCCQGQNVYQQTLDITGFSNHPILHKITEDEQGNLWIASSQGLIKYNGITFNNFSQGEARDKEFINVEYDPYYDRIWCSNILNQLLYLSNGKLQEVPLDNGIKILDYEFLDSSIYVWGVLKSEYILWKGHFDENGNLATWEKYGKIKAQEIKPVGGLFIGAIERIGGQLYIHGPSFLVKVLGPNNFLIRRWDNELLHLNHINIDSCYIYNFFRDTNIMLKYDHDLKFIDSLKIPDGIKMQNIYLSKNGFLGTLSPLEIKHFNKDFSKIEKVFSGSEKYLTHCITTQHGISWGLSSNAELIKIVSDQSKIYPLLLNSNEGIQDIRANKDGIYILSNAGKLFKVNKNDSIANIIDLNYVTKELILKENDEYIIITKDFVFDSGLGYIQLACPKKAVIKGDILYSASCGGLMAFNTKSKETSTLVSSRLFSICESPDGFYIGSQSGLILKEFRSEKHCFLETWPQLKIPAIIQSDLHGNTWIASKSTGLYKVNDQRVEPFVSSYIRPETTVSNILLVNKLLWLFTDENLFVYNPDIDDFIPLTGRGGLDANNYIDVAFFNDRYWFANKKELISFPKEIVKSSYIAPNIDLVKVSVNNQPVSDLKNLKSYENNINIELSTTDFVTNHVKYFFKLIHNNNSKDAYVRTSKENRIRLYELKTGDYRFILSKNKFFFDDQNAIYLDFSILPPLHKRLWFLILVLLTTIFLTVLSYRYLNLIKIKRHKIREALLDEMNQLKTDALQQKIGPHFINNVLNNARYYIMVENDNVKSTNMLNSLSIHFRDIFNQMNNKNISLRQEITFIENYISLEKQLRDFQIVYQIELFGNLPDQLDTTYLPNMLLQPLVENCINYRVPGKEAKLWISLELLDSFLFVKVRDEGVGFSKKISEMGRLKPSSLKAVDQRIQLINKEKVGLVVQRDEKKKQTVVQFKIKSHFNKK